VREIVSPLEEESDSNGIDLVCQQRCARDSAMYDRRGFARCRSNRSDSATSTLLSRSATGHDGGTDVMMIFVHGVVAAALVTAVVSNAAYAVPMDSEAVRQIRGLLVEKGGRTAAQRKIASHLIYAGKASRGEPIAADVPSLPVHVQADAGGRVLVDITARVSPAILGTIGALGGTVVSSFGQYTAIRAWLPLDRMEDLAAMPEVAAIRPAATPVHRRLTTSEGDVAHRANLARATFGIDGSGVTVGVLSDSVDNLATVQGSGDLGPVTVLPGLSGVPATGEGTALLEIVYDLAPGAALMFATTGDSEAAMATNILALRDAGCDILVDDVAFPTEPVFQDGIIAQAVETVAAGGAVYVSAAGNGGNLDSGTSGTWEGDFAASTSTVAVGSTQETLHDFGAGAVHDAITALPNAPPVIITLQWSDPFDGAADDYDLFIFRGSRVIDASTDFQGGMPGDNPLEIVDITNDVSRFGASGLSVAIGKASGEARYLHLDTNGGALALGTAGEINGHPVAADAVAVAAVSAAGLTAPFAGGAADPVELFSSDGPRRVFYRADGTPITPGNFLATGGTVRQKPDVAAADGVMVAAPGFAPFFGTSAAAAHAAGIAALVKSANPALTTAQIRTALTSTAFDIAAPGVDRDSGFGLLDAFAAVQSVVADRATPSSTPPAAHTATRLPSATPIATVTPGSVCVGDCDQNGAVTVDELVKAVNIALGHVLLTQCPALDCTGSGQVLVSCLVAAVGDALNGCGVGSATRGPLASR
jgi:subtilisin family serine protease